MTKSWPFKGSAIQDGLPGHGDIANRIQVEGVVAMLDKAHVAVRADFEQLLTLPDGTVRDSTKHSDNSTRLAKKLQFVVKLDVSKTNGIGEGTTGWFRSLDEDHLGNTIHPGGTKVNSDIDVHGDADGNMIVTYTGYSGYNVTAEAGTGGVHFLTKLAAEDGRELWKREFAKPLSECEPITDGSLFCGVTMTEADSALDFGDSVVVPVIPDSDKSPDSTGKLVATKAVVVKFNPDGIAQWASTTHDANFERLSVSADGTLLAIAGTPLSGRVDFLSRIDTSSGNEGAVLWTDMSSGGGTHGFRGVEVVGTEVIGFGQITSTMTLTDSTGSKTTLSSRGSYEVFVAAFDAADGTGKWAMDGGSDGLDYFFAFASDSSTGDIYVGGASYDTPQYFQWGDVKRKNAMYQYKPSADIPGYVGTQKAFVAKIKTTTSLPTCVDSCSAGTSVVKAGHCYIDRHCYAAGDFSPYPGADCMYCGATTEASSGPDTTSQTTWSGPDTTSHCFIDGKCVSEGAHEQVVTGQGRRGPIYSDDPCSKCMPSVEATDYSPIAAGCLVSTMHAFAHSAPVAPA